MLRLSRAVAVVAAIIALAGCGQASSPAAPVSDGFYPGQTAAQVLDLARTAVSSTSAVRLQGRANFAQDASGPSGIGATGALNGPVDFSFSVVNAKGSSGNLTIGGGRFTLVMIRDQVYTRMDTKLLSQLGPFGASLAGTLRGRWLQSDSRQAAAISLVSASIGATQSDLFSLSSSSAVLGTYLPSGSTLSRVPGRTINGVPTTGVHFSRPRTAGGQAVEGTIYLAARGTPYPAEIDRPDITLRFSDWNQAVRITRPPAAEVVTLAKLGLNTLSPDALTSELENQIPGYTGAAG